jgi:dTDP-3-amino-3,4,6-trideoxy-alpha-D-glucose transaminase
MDEPAVLLNDFPRQWKAVREAVHEAVERVGASGWYILGPEVSEFERRLAEFWPAAFAVGVGNGLDALEIGLRCLDVKDGDRVLTTPLSAFATTLAILRVGAVPVFADVDERGLLDLNLCHELLRQDHNIRALVPVHLYGHALDQKKLEALRLDFGIALLEDCAQSIGAESNGRRTGTVADVAATSFYPTKNLGAFGDAGALLTRNHEIAVRARALRHYGQTATYAHDFVGLNSRLDELHGAVLSQALLPHLEAWTCRRREVAARYLEGLSNPALALTSEPPGSRSVWHLFPVLVPRGLRDSFVRHLRERGVSAGMHYPCLIPDQRALQERRFEVAGELTRARRFADSEVSLPIHPFLTDAEVDRVIEVCNGWEGR